MKSTSELHQFYRTKLLSQLKQLDEVRQGIVRKIIFVALLCIALAAYIGLKAYGEGWDYELLVIPVAVGAILGFFYIQPGYARYVASFKESIMKELVSFLNPSLNYIPTAFVNKQDFRKSGIFNGDIDRYRGDDLVEGTIGSTKIGFSEIHVEDKRETTDGKGNTRTEWHTIFKGLFFCADFNKHFQGETYVLTDVAEAALGFIGTSLQKLNRSHGELVKLENPDFEKEFAVYGSDQIEARYILSPALMERILQFKRKTGRKIQLSFVDSSVFIAVPYTRDLFEPRLFRDNANFDSFEEYFNDLALALGIVEDLNLNNRIWTKH